MSFIKRRKIQRSSKHDCQCIRGWNEWCCTMYGHTSSYEICYNDFDFSPNLKWKIGRPYRQLELSNDILEIIIWLLSCLIHIFKSRKAFFYTVEAYILYKSYPNKWGQSWQSCVQKLFIKLAFLGFLSYNTHKDSQFLKIQLNAFWASVLYVTIQIHICSS